MSDVSECDLEVAKTTKFSEKTAVLADFWQRKNQVKSTKNWQGVLFSLFEIQEFA